MALEEYYAGRRHEMLVYRSESGSSQVEDFVESLQDSDQVKLVALLRRAADYGPPFNNNKVCKPVEGTKFFEFKQFQVRVFWRRVSGNRIVLMYGFKKQQDKISKSDIEIGHKMYGLIENERSRKEGHNGSSR